jgi:EAL domain-containing protein (putative c-di-GMP-specific phosphodiesterase class I)
MLLRQVGAALALAGLPADRLRLELPESALMELDEDAWLMLAALRDVGIELWLDNFGAGQISLGVLRRLPLTGVKLDLSLVRELPDNAETCRFAATLVDVSLLHGLRVCALGVETPAQQEFLAGLGCQEAQGQLLAPPVPAAEFRTDRRSKPRDTGAALWRRAAVPAGG